MRTKIVHVNGNVILVRTFDILFKMEQKSNLVTLLRLVHGAFVIYFISCIGIIYYTFVTMEIGLLFVIAILSLVIEGILVFVLNGGDCPLIHIQKKIGDPVPFFNLFLPDHVAKKTMPFFTAITFFGIALLIIRFILKI